MRTFYPLTFALCVASVTACGDASRVVEPLNPPPAEALNPTLARGASLAQQVCAQCHGPTFEGGILGATTCPSLNAVRKYSLEDFNQLLARGIEVTGEPIGETMGPALTLDEEDRLAVYLYFIRVIDTR